MMGPAAAALTSQVVAALQLPWQKSVLQASSLHKDEETEHTASAVAFPLRLILVVVAALVCASFAYVGCRQLFTSHKGISRAVGLPLIGSLLDFCAGPRRLVALASRLGAVFQMFFLGEWAVVVSGSANLRKVFAGEGTLVRAEWPEATQRLLGPNSLATQSGTTHAQQRRLLSQAFTPHNLAAMISEIVELCQTHLDGWAKAGSICGYDAIKDFALQVAMGPLLHLDFEHHMEMGEQFRHYLKGLFALPINLGRWTQFGRALHAREYLLDEIEKSVKARLASGLKSADTLQTMMEAVDEETGEKLTMTQLKDQVLLQLFAGHDTTASAMTALVWLLAKNPTALASAKEEQASVIARFGAANSLGREALASMPLLDSIIKETLRLFPPIAGGFRRALTDFALNDGKKEVIVPKGAALLYSIALTQSMRRSELVAGDDFVPARFVEGEAPGTKSGCAVDSVASGFCPFAAGRRSCIGMPLAKLKMKIFGSVFARTFAQVHLDNPESGWDFFPIPTPKDKLRVHLVR